MKIVKDGFIITTIEDNSSTGICTLKPFKGLNTRVLYGGALCPNTMRPPVAVPTQKFLG
jgi:hypothetical protein